MAHDASNNNPVKEILHALIGIGMFLAIVLGIAVSAFLRPAGNHEPATVSATPAGQALDEFYQKNSAPTEEQKAEAVAEATANDSTSDTSASATAEADAQAQIEGSNGDAPVAVQDKPAEDKPQTEEATATLESASESK